MTDRPTTPTAAHCCSCGQLRPVHCDSGYTENPDGTVSHDDPLCADCCGCYAARQARTATVQQSNDQQYEYGLDAGRAAATLPEPERGLLQRQITTQQGGLRSLGLASPWHDGFLAALETLTAPSDECPACSRVGGGPLCKAHASIVSTLDQDR